jgi:hypothetical protein
MLHAGLGSTYFDAAIASDANYAIAFAGKADALLAMDRNIYAPGAYAAAKAAAERAIELDSDLSEAHGALASVLARDYLDKMLAQQEADVPEILVSPELAFMQSDPRFAAMRQRLHLTP